jgi:hypothetical protein
MRRSLFLVPILAAVVALAACTTEDREDPLFDEEVTTALQDKGQLPEWLADYVGYLECSPEGKELLGTSERLFSGVYRFNWNGDTYYEIYSPIQNRLHASIYTAEGIPVELTETSYKDFAEQVHDWTIVYVFQPNFDKPYWNIPGKGSHYLPKSVELEKNAVKLSETLHDVCYVVFNEEQLRALYSTPNELPHIDFSKNALILGRTTVPKNAELKRMDLTEKSEGKYAGLRLLFEEKLPISNQCAGEGSKEYYFWALFDAVGFSSDIKWQVSYNNKSSDYIYPCLMQEATEPFATKMRAKNPPRWYLDHYVTADGLCHQVSRGYGNEMFCVQFDNVINSSGKIMGDMSVFTNAGRFVLRFNAVPAFDIFKYDDSKMMNCFDFLHAVDGIIDIEQPPIIVYEDDLELESYFQKISRERRFEKYSTIIDFLCRNLGHVKKFTSKDSLHLSLMVSDSVRFEFCHEDCYPTGEKFDLTKGISLFVSKNQQRVALFNFLNYSRGHGWILEEEHEMVEDGTYRKEDYRNYRIGQAVHAFIFPKNEYQARLFYTMSDRADEIKHTDYTIRFDASLKEIFLYDGNDKIETYILLSCSDKEMLILRPGEVIFTNHGHGYELSDYRYMIFRLMTDEELQYFIDNY